MNKDYTHISVILDRTGSMEGIRDDTIGGFNSFLGEQQKETGQATMTLVQFDSQDPYEVIHQFTPVKDVAELTRETYVPRATTPLLDAIGRGINDLEQQISQLPDPGKPARVVFAIVTDGQENASTEFTREQILKMIESKEKESDWLFVFLSADLSSVEDARTYGMQDHRIMSYDKESSSVSAAWSSVNAHVSGLRTGKTRDIAFTDEDRSKHKSEAKRKKN